MKKKKIVSRLTQEIEYLQLSKCGNNFECSTIIYKKDISRDNFSSKKIANLTSFGELYFYI